LEKAIKRESPSPPPPPKKKVLSKKASQHLSSSIQEFLSILYVNISFQEGGFVIIRHSRQHELSTFVILTLRLKHWFYQSRHSIFAYAFS
jgi:hypothetical protein